MTADGSPFAGAVATGEADGWPVVAVGPDGALRASGDDVAALLRGGGQGRWVVWSARSVARFADAVDEGGDAEGRGALDRTWDVQQVHALLHGGMGGSPGLAWAAARGLDAGDLPAPPTGDLFDLLASDDGALVAPDGHLRADAAAWAVDADRCAELARAALEVARWQHGQVAARGPRALLTAASESATAVLCLELERDGLPVDRVEAERLVTAAAGPEPRTLQDELDARAVRDAPVLAAVPGAGPLDLRSPAAVRRLLGLAGIEVESTRKWVLEAHRDAHPVVPALLAWRTTERVATTYGWRWLREHVGADDRLRGRWHACDGAAGRMTAQAGLHNLPAELRPAVAAAPGHRLVRADLGQVEPRVVAAVSGDEALAAATRSPDLYAPVAARLGVERPVAKVAVLAAMYGQRSGAAGEALRGMERAYPVAMGFLDAAQERGRRGEPVRTHGGRLVRTAIGAGPRGEGEELGASAQGLEGARGRYARNAVVQGSAAELFKVWAVTTRARLRPLRARVVLCLHDELLVHVPTEHAQEAAQVLHDALADAARWWVADERVHLLADVGVVDRWSEAK